MSSVKEYHGNCHCKAFRYTLRYPEITKVSECTCGICARKGYLFLDQGVERETDITVHSDGDKLKEYRFGDKDIGHSFCTICGSAVFRTRLDGKLDLNLRMINNLDINSLETSVIDPTPSPPTKPKPTSSSPNDRFTYQGSCHCQSITYTVCTPPLATQEIMSCNCSLCARNRDLWIYPSKEDVSITRPENLTEYAFLSDDSLHSFCSACGVSVCVNVLDEEEDVCPLNVRTLEGVDLRTLTFKFYDGWKNDPVYIV